MLEQRFSDTRLSDLVLSEGLEGKVNRIIIEYRKKELLRKNGLKNRSKVMLTGNPFQILQERIQNPAHLAYIIIH